MVKPGSHAYEMIRSWVADGAKVNFDSQKATKITLYPENPVIQSIGDQQQIRVIASYANGEERDVSQESFTQSGNTEIVEVDDSGLITTLRRGEAAEVLKKANAREANEADKRSRFEAGELGLDIYEMRERLAQKGLKYV